MRTRTQERTVKQPILPQIEEKEVKILNLAVHLEKLTAQLSDGRELSIPIDWFAKWGVKGISADKLRKYEIRRGVNIYFPDLDEVLGIEVFIHGFNTPYGYFKILINTIQKTNVRK